MRHAYALRWNLFVEWRSSHQEDPRRCPIRVMLSFLQQVLKRRLSPSTLKVYVAAISAHHDPTEGKSVGKHDLVIRFLRGARRLNLPRPPSVSTWDLSLVLTALRQAPFEPLHSVELKFLSMKTLLLLALASIKRVGDLHAFLVEESCLEFGPADSQVTLRPWPGYVPKVPTTPFRNQVVSLQALPPEEADPALALLCPVRALRLYVDRTQSFRTSDQLFVCFGGRQKGNAISKQRIAHWIVDAITLAYQAHGVPCPLRL
ncbi:Altered inheritance of mitochondria protein 21 [Labeo rohita]|uniref:Altered inheritance of mitochondria protein 21 n=1 Tax=Labeo rohita TaxID=84645 RepID=A0ABQ8MSC7_LABRO|nr:Altered inheritance of mitochondria protein 21 [Labeo rohita]